MRFLMSRAGWVLSGVLGLFVVATLADVISAGPLDPPGAPGSTLQRIADVPPSWHQILPANNGDGAGCGSTRFECVMGGLAVLDHETGLVWQRNVAADATDWPNAFVGCELAEIGGRYGWHLPTQAQLRSLADASADHLPDSHPFVGAVNLPSDRFWTSSLIYAGAVSAVRVVDFDAPGQYLQLQQTEQHRRWCVRGGVEWDERWSQ